MNSQWNQSGKLPWECHRAMGENQPQLHLLLFVLSRIRNLLSKPLSNHAEDWLKSQSSQKLNTRAFCLQLFEFLTKYMNTMVSFNFLRGTWIYSRVNWSIICIWPISVTPAITSETNLQVKKLVRSQKNYYERESVVRRSREIIDLWFTVYTIMF